MFAVVSLFVSVSNDWDKNGITALCMSAEKNEAIKHRTKQLHQHNSPKALALMVHSHP